MRNKSKEKDKAKAIYRRSMSMNDLLQTMAVAGGPEAQWALSIDNLDGEDSLDSAGSTRRNGQRLKELALSTNAIDCEALTLPSAGHSRNKQRLRVKDNASCEDMAGSSDDPKSLGTLNGSLSRPHSESSGEFSLSLDQDVWSSSGSSPVQQPSLSRSSRQSPLQLRRALDPSTTSSPGQCIRKNGSPGSEVVSLQQFLNEGVDPAESGSQENLTVDSPRLSTSSDHGMKERPASKGRGILRSSSSRAAPVSSERPPRSTALPGRPALRKAESTRVKGSGPRASLSTQAKASSVSERLDSSSSTLPRASSVISTAEGTTRRTSIHDMLSKDNRQPVSVDASPPTGATKAGLRSQPTPSEYHPHTSVTPLPKSLSLPCHSLDDPELSNLESLLGPSFTVESVFMDSIFSESSAKNLPFLSLNPNIVSNISGPPKVHPSPKSQTAAPQSNSRGFGEVNSSEEALSTEDQSLWYEYGCV